MATANQNFLELAKEGIGMFVRLDEFQTGKYAVYRIVPGGDKTLIPEVEEAEKKIAEAMGCTWLPEPVGAWVLGEDEFQGLLRFSAAINRKVEIHLLKTVSPDNNGGIIVEMGQQ